jgi:hypothetical protein
VTSSSRSGQSGRTRIAAGSRGSWQPRAGAVRESDTSRVELTRKLVMHDRDQLDECPQAAVVLRLVGQMRKPARQHAADQAEKLPIGTDPDRCLADCESDQIRVLTSAGRPWQAGTRYSSAKTYAATTRASRSSSRAPISRGLNGLEALRLQASGPCETRPTFTSSLSSRAR